MHVLRRRPAAAAILLAATTMAACKHGASSSGSAGTTAGSGGGNGSGGGCVHGAFPSPDIYDAHCNLDPAAYVHLAGSLSTDEGLRYRFGPDSTHYHPSLTLPTVPRVPIRLCGDGPINGPPPANIFYQLGNDCDIKNPGNYSSDQAVVLYRSDVPLVPDAGSAAGGGVDNIAIQGFAYNSFLYLPSPSADFGSAGPAYAYQLTSPSWTALAGGHVGSPVVAARGIAPSFGQTSQVAFVAFDDGLIGTIGTNTEQGGYVTSLAAGLVPTGVGLTNGNEFMLVTLWDTKNIAGKLAVFAVESDHAGMGDLDDQYKYDFRIHLPGFVSTGDATSMKLLGVVDLPGMIAPTDIAVASDYQAAFFKNQGANAQPGDLDLTNQAVWQTFTGTGENATQRSTGGFAVIASRSERKVAFVDLQPLFDAFNAQYFTSFSGFQTTQSNYGSAPDQWPYTFEKLPQATPVVVSTITLSEIPTAVYAGRSGTLDPTAAIHALVATMDGTLHIYDAGGLVDASAASASAIKEIGSVTVGNNPTCIATRKAGTSSASQPDPVSGASGNIEGQQVFVVARGDRAVDFVMVQGATGTVYKKLQDSALIDPVAVDDADHESFLSYVLSVADLGGRQIVNYRYGPVTFPSDQSVYPLPLGADGKPTFESGGGYSVQGTPFAVSGTNVP
jgi:hypothetical protein